MLSEKEGKKKSEKRKEKEGEREASLYSQSLSVNSIESVLLVLISHLPDKLQGKMSYPPTQNKLSLYQLDSLPTWPKDT